MRPNSQQALQLIWSHFLVLLKSDLDVKHAHRGCFVKKALATALGVTKFMTIIAMNMVTLCSATYVRQMLNKLISRASLLNI
jgi:hypothetical protein